MVRRNSDPYLLGALVVVGLFLMLALAAIPNLAWAAPPQQGTVPPPVPTGRSAAGPTSEGATVLMAPGGATAPGSVMHGTTSVTLPAGSVPVGSNYTLYAWDYDPASVPNPADGQIGFRGPGDNNLGIMIVDQNGNRIRSLPLPGLTICFSYPANIQLPPDGNNIQYWTGSAWATLANPTLTGPTNGYYTLCVSLTSW
ncbi:MAG: hypothetical protein HY782_09315 [Chloroflexi bacterium]|nr:hypothetical protein [Chloroflexota bacterium]